MREIPWNDEFYAVPGRVDDWHIGYEDHGCFTLHVGFRMGSSGHGTGHRIIWSKKSTPEQIAEGMAHLVALVDVLGNVQNWRSREVMVLYRKGDRHTVAGVATMTSHGERQVVFDDVTAAQMGGDDAA